MKAKNVLNIWTGWDSPDIFEVHETAPNGRFISRHDMTGVEFVHQTILQQQPISQQSNPRQLQQLPLLRPNVLQAKQWGYRTLRWHR